ncbi:hypothetical protein LCGC14_0510150 [marine sediment metagenome]|uniref:Uncharacterized protein n=1 Tax=marine sediment metagenome TaxID=412755 RepID=A0A0F9S676_9ZZZZ
MSKKPRMFHQGEQYVLIEELVKDYVSFSGSHYVY